MVRAHRRRLGLSQEELAEKAGVNARTIGNIEAGRIQAPRPATVRLLATAFNLRGVDHERFCAAAIPAPDPWGTVPEPGRLVPRQLPAATRHFVGRMDELDLLDAMAADGQSGGAIVISAIAGTAGIGKTALALHWAHQVADRFPDGQLYVNLRGFDPAAAQLSPSEALRGFLDALEVPARRIPGTLDGQAALFRSVVADRRMLVVLDNARDTDQVRPLLPGNARCLVMVTSRHRLSGLVAAESARAITLGLLSTVDAEQLLSVRLGRDRIRDEPRAVREIIDHCAGLPLALAIVAARASTQPGLSLARLAAELRAAPARLDALSGGEAGTDVRAVFALSYEALSAGAARLFRLFGLHPGTDFTVAAAASLAGQPRAAIAPLLNELTRAHLMAEHEPGRYASHDLLRLYAAEVAARDETQEERREAFGRLFDHYLHTAYQGGRLLDPHRNPITLGAPRTGAEPEAVADEAEAMTWLAAERENLLAFFDASRGTDEHRMQLAWSMATYLYRRGLWADLIKSHEAAVEASHRIGDAIQECTAHLNIARAYTWLGRTDDARSHLERGLAIATATGQLSSQANAHQGLSNLLARIGHDREALHHARQAHDLFATSGQRRGQASSLNNMGMLHMRIGESEAGLAACRQALALHEELGGREGQAAAWDNLGAAHQQLGDHQAAITCYGNALPIVRALTDRHHEAIILDHLGDAHEAAGDVRAAAHAWREAVSILESIESDDTTTVRSKLLNLRQITDDFPGTR